MRNQQQSRRICECDTIPTGRPSRYDAYQEGEEIIPNPLCPVHTYEDEYLREIWDAIEQVHGLVRANDGEWIPVEKWDDETGDRKQAA